MEKEHASAGLSRLLLPRKLENAGHMLGAINVELDRGAAIR